MEDKGRKQRDAAELRLRAEAVVLDAKVQVPEDFESEKARATFHELQVHQIELEMQNEELRRTQADLATSRARYFDLYDLAPSGYVTIGPKGQILEANLTTALLLGLDRRSLGVQFFSRFILPDDQDIHYQRQKELSMTEKPSAYEIRMARKDGTAFWAHLRVSIAQDGNGEKVFHVIMNDISERKGIERALQEAYEEKKNFLIELQHRVKNSFSMICSMINLASGDDVSAETKAILTQLDTRVRSVSALYSQLYASGSMTEVRLDDYFTRITDTLAGLAHNVSIPTEMEDIVVAVGDAAPIGLILTELVTNSVKYAFPGSRTGIVSVSLKRVGADALLEVRDNGVGLPAGFNLSTSSGMGLHLVQGLTNQIKGSFSIEGGPTGTYCRVSFPVG